MARLNAKCADDLRERLQARAAAEDRSESWCIVRAVEAWLGEEPASVGGQGRGSSRAAVPGQSAGPASPATPRASAPAFNRATSLGAGPPRPVPRRSR